MTEERLSILAKIKKLQAMTVDRGASPEEAATAAAKVQALLFEHNLSQVEVDAATSDKPEAYGRTEHMLGGANRRSVTWQRTLLHVIAENNFCSTVYTPGTTRVYVIGKKSNVEAVLYLNDIVARQIANMAKAASRSILTGKAQYEVSFCRGAVATVRERLREQRQRDVTAATSTHANATQNALMLRSAETALQDAIKTFWPKLGKPSRSRVSNYDGFQAGRQAGYSVGLNHGVGQSARGLLN